MKIAVLSSHTSSLFWFRMVYLVLLMYLLTFFIDQFTRKVSFKKIQ